MNVIKHMEAAFVLSLAVAGLSAVAIGSLPQAQARVAVQERLQPGVPVVHVSARRMTNVEKQQSLALERVAKRA